jgi:sugar phosphate isomerase/epimerase
LSGQRAILAIDDQSPEEFVVSSGMIAGFGFSTIQKRDLSDLDEILSRIEDLGATHAELSLRGADLVCGGRLLSDRVDRLARICARHRLAYTAHGPLAANFMDPVHLDAYKAAVAAMLEVCGAVGATVLVQHTGRVGAAPDIEIERLHAQERDALRAMGDIGARHGVKLAVETIWAFDRAQYTATAARLADEIRAVDHPFVCGALDFSHVYLYSTFRGLDFLEQVAAFAPVTGHLHVHDSFGRPKLAPIYAPSEELAFGLGDLHLPLGWGDIPWDDMLPRLAVRDDTVFMIELPPQFAEEAPQVAVEARRLIGLVGAAL